MAVTLTDSFQNLLQRCMYCCVDIVSLCACALIYSCIVRSRQKIAVLREGMHFEIVNAAPLPCVTIIPYPPKFYFISYDLIGYVSIIVYRMSKPSFDGFYIIGIKIPNFQVLLSQIQQNVQIIQCDGTDIRS